LEPAKPEEIPIGGGRSAVGKGGAVVVIPVHLNGKCELPKISGTESRACSAAGFAQGGEKEGCQDGDDRPHHEEFGQGEASCLGIG
jgi:hypothetical protein